MDLVEEGCVAGQKDPVFGRVGRTDGQIFEGSAADGETEGVDEVVAVDLDDGVDEIEAEDGDVLEIPGVRYGVNTGWQVDGVLGKAPANKSGKHPSLVEAIHGLP